MSLMGHPPGHIFKRNVHFYGDVEPEPGDIVESFSGMQYRILEVELAKTRYKVVEEKMHPDDYVDDPDWQYRKGA